LAALIDPQAALAIDRLGIRLVSFAVLGGGDSIATGRLCSSFPIGTDGFQIL
jgi:hypothetical protein